MVECGCGDGGDTGLIHLRSFPSWFGIYKRKLRQNRRTPSFINLDIFWRMYISSFVRTQTFSVDSTHSFIHEAPDRWYKISSKEETTFYLKTYFFSVIKGKWALLSRDKEIIISWSLDNRMDKDCRDHGSSLLPHLWYLQKIFLFTADSKLSLSKTQDHISRNQTSLYRLIATF